MESPRISFFSLLVFVIAVSAPFAPEIAADSEIRTYIVHVQPPENTVFASPVDRETWYKSFIPTATASSEQPAMVHMYTNVLSGFAARLTEQELDAMSKKEGFVHAVPTRTLSIKTTHTPKFLGLDLHKGLWKGSNLGKGVIIGLLDTGVFPDHPSFSGDGMPPPPSKWKGRCELNATSCNNKLIGARVFLGSDANTSHTPLDDVGHGTHTSSTAAGAFVADAEVMGNARGAASGMAPYAHVAMYRVCIQGGCEDSDILAGMDAAISDGVDVLSISLGGAPSPFYEESIAIGAYRAMEKGIFISCAAGNSGPGSSTLSNDAPWILTVGASTIDRSITATVKLGNGLEFTGQSLFQPKSFAPTLLPLAYGAFCGNGSFEGVDVKGKIVLCERGGPVVSQAESVKSAGGIGMILINPNTFGHDTFAGFAALPASNIDFFDGMQIKEYMNSTANPMAAIVFKGTVLGTSPAPTVVFFSSRGPSLISPGILKPDITGPGVNILAAWPSFVGEPSPNYTGAPFYIISGTSMATPHLGGIAALLKSAHPDWSPAAIKSAIMTTSDTLDRSGNSIGDERRIAADLFATGAGHVNPNQAMNPGLVYDIGPDDYISYLCGLGYNNTQVTMITGRPIDCSTIKKITEGELNYPSITAAFGAGTMSMTLERTVKNVGKAKSTYWVKVEAPMGVSVDVEPKMLGFWMVNQELKFQVTLSITGGSKMGVAQQGYLMWVSKKHTVRSPISVAFKK